MGNGCCKLVQTMFRGQLNMGKNMCNSICILFLHLHIVKKVLKSGKEDVILLIEQLNMRCNFVIKFINLIFTFKVLSVLKSAKGGVSN
jgi:hypothetical protein